MSPTEMPVDRKIAGILFAISIDDCGVSLARIDRPIDTPSPSLAEFRGSSQMQAGWSAQ
jgi:hypothetical protein